MNADDELDKAFWLDEATSELPTRTTDELWHLLHGMPSESKVKILNLVCDARESGHWLGYSKGLDERKVGRGSRKSLLGKIEKEIEEKVKKGCQLKAARVSVLKKYNVSESSYFRWKRDCDDDF